jgi:hypothetical protein
MWTPLKVFSLGLYFATFVIFKLYSYKYIAIIPRLALNMQNDILVEEPHWSDYAVVQYLEICFLKTVIMSSLKEIFLVATVGSTILSLEHSLLKLSKHYRAIFFVSISHILSIISEFDHWTSRKPFLRNRGEIGNYKRLSWIERRRFTIVLQLVWVGSIAPDGWGAIGIPTIVVVAEASVWIVFGRYWMRMRSLAGPLLAQLAAHSVHLVAAVVRSIVC